MSKKNLYLTDTSLGTYGIYISSDTYLDAPQIDYVEYQVPGRTGNAILDRNRLNNVIRRFDCYIPEGTNIDTTLDSLKKLLYLNRGYVKLSSDYEPSRYQYGYLAQELNVKPFNLKTAEFSLYFSCVPKKYSTANSAHDATHAEVNNYLTSYFRNDNTDLVNLLANAKINYPYSPVGWMCDFGTYSVNAGTYTVTCSSTTTQKYMVVLADRSAYHPYTYELVGEVDNYSGSFTVDVPSVYQSEFVIVAAAPILSFDQEIDVTANGNTNQMNFIYNPITSTELSSNTDIGCEPQFLYKKQVFGSNLNISEGGTDLFVLNDNMYIVDYYRLVNDYTAQTVFDTCAYQEGTQYFMYVKVDFANAKFYLLDSYSFDGNIVLDASNYFIESKKGDLGDSVTAKLATGWPIEASGTSFTERRIKGIKFKMGWWKL